MNKKSRNILLTYIIIALFDVGGARIYQEYLYHAGRGYQMFDLDSLVVFFAVTLTTTLVWYREVERNSDKNTWRFFIIAAVIMSFLSIAIAEG